MQGGVDGVHQLAAIDDHGKVGTGAGAGIQLALTLAGDGRENDDAGAALDHGEAFLGRTVSGRGDHDVIEAGAVENRLAASSEGEPSGALNLTDKRIAKRGIGRDDPDG